MRQQDALDLGRVHVGAAAQDQLVLPAPDHQLAVGIEVAEVAGVEKATPQRLAGRLGPVPVAEHRGPDTGPPALAASPEAHFADLSVGQVDTSPVDDEHLDRV